MPSQTVAKRLEQLEKAVQSLTDVPTPHAGAELQFLQLQRETRAEVSAIRRELATTRADLEAAIAPLATRAEMLALHGDLAERMKTLASRSEMLILHEDLVERLKTLSELWRTPPRTKRR